MRQILIGIAGILAGAALCWLLQLNKYDRRVNRSIEEIDSLRKAYIEQKYKYIALQNRVCNIIDSLNKEIKETEIHYEVVYKDYADPGVVSDDSISSYISKKIHNIE